MITWGTFAATLAAPLVFLLPGWALLNLLLPRRADNQPAPRCDAASWLILAAGLTLALMPVALLFLYLARLRVSTGAILAILALSAAVVAWRAWWRDRPSWQARLERLDALLLALVLVTALVVGVRLWAVRGINVGFWGDSYQHTMIVQLMLDNGGLFQSWEPYAPLRTFTYHFGFHANVALFQWATGWLTGNSTPRAVVLVGQFLNALAALSLYPLTVRLSGGRRWAGVVAVLVAGLLTMMPMFYVNWGRYTQLTGQAILPVALWFTLEAAEAERWDTGRLAAAALTVAGLGLTHYRIAVFYLTFLLLYLGYRLLLARRLPRRWPMPFLRLAVVGLGALLLVTPWLWRLGSGLLPGNLARYQRGEASLALHEEYNAFLINWRFSPGWLVWPALLGAAWAMIRRSPMSLVAFWAGLVLAVANLYRLGFDIGLVNNFTVIISLYLPTAMLLGYLVGDLLELATRRLRLVQGVALVLVAAAGIAGAGARSDVLDRTYQLVTPTDEQAMAWIRQNTPPDARFLVNSFFAFGGHYIVGSDAGWWIPLLAGRGNTVPPATYSMEVADPPNYQEQVHALARRIEAGRLDDLELVNFLRSRGITYIYIGQVGGPLLNPDLLRRSPYYEPVYDQDGVLILALK